MKPATRNEIRKEQIKLTAAYANGLAIVSTSAGIVALPISLLSQPKNMWLYDFLSPGMVAAGIAFHFMARWHLQYLARLEEPPTVDAANEKCRSDCSERPYKTVPIPDESQTAAPPL